MEEAFIICLTLPAKNGKFSSLYVTAPIDQINLTIDRGSAHRFDTEEEAVAHLDFLLENNNDIEAYDPEVIEL